MRELNSTASCCDREPPGASAAIAALAAGSAVAMIGLLTDLQLGQIPAEVLAAAVSAMVFLIVTVFDRQTR